LYGFLLVDERLKSKFQLVAKSGIFFHSQGPEVGGTCLGLFLQIERIHFLQLSFLQKDQLTA
jgi:hypothetical protein